MTQCSLRKTIPYLWVHCRTHEWRSAACGVHWSTHEWRSAAFGINTRSLVPRAWNIKEQKQCTVYDFWKNIYIQPLIDMITRPDLSHFCEVWHFNDVPFVSELRRYLPPLFCASAETWLTRFGVVLLVIFVTSWIWIFIFALYLSVLVKSASAKTANSVLSFPVVAGAMYTGFVSLKNCDRYGIAEKGFAQLAFGCIHPTVGNQR